MKFGEKLKALRNKHGLTQDDLAIALNTLGKKSTQVLEVNRFQIAQWELGNNLPNMDRALLLCKFFNVTLDMFFVNSEEIKGSKINLKSIILN